MMMTTVKMILFRRSGTLNIFFRLDSVVFMRRLLARLPSSYRSRRLLGRQSGKNLPGYC
jgi:hypothetical protein